MSLHCKRAVFNGASPSPSLLCGSGIEAANTPELKTLLANRRRRRAPPRHRRTPGRLRRILSLLPCKCCSLSRRHARRLPRVKMKLRVLHALCKSYMLTQEKPPREHVLPRGELKPSLAPGSDHLIAGLRRPIPPFPFFFVYHFLPRRQEQLISIHLPTFPQSPGSPNRSVGTGVNKQNKHNSLSLRGYKRTRRFCHTE